MKTKYFTRLLLSILIIIGSILIQSCKKEVNMDECQVNDASRYTGDWIFVVNGDQGTSYMGQIHRYSYNTLNVHYQPENLNTSGDNYFKQLKLNNIENGVFEIIEYPLGNTGGWVRKEGEITNNTFEYREMQSEVNYVTGEETYSEKIITGTKVE